MKCIYSFIYFKGPSITRPPQDPSWSCGEWELQVEGLSWGNLGLFLNHDRKYKSSYSNLTVPLEDDQDDWVRTFKDNKNFTSPVRGLDPSFPRWPHLHEWARTWRRRAPSWTCPSRRAHSRRRRCSSWPRTPCPPCGLTFDMIKISTVAVRRIDSLVCACRPCKSTSPSSSAYVLYEKTFFLKWFLIILKTK